MHTPGVFDSSLAFVQQKNFTLSLIGALAFPGVMFGRALAKLGLYSTPTITGARCLPPEGADAFSASAGRAR